MARGQLLTITPMTRGAIIERNGVQEVDGYGVGARLTASGHTTSRAGGGMACSRTRASAPRKSRSLHQPNQRALITIHAWRTPHATMRGTPTSARTRHANHNRPGSAQGA